MKTIRSFIEPLEQRIAPALLVNGANLLGGSSPATGETSSGDNSLTLVKVLAGQAIVWYDGASSSITGISVGPGASLDINGDIYGDIIANLDATGQLSDSDSDPTNGRDGGVLLPNNILGITTHPLSNENGDIGHVITGGSISNVNISGQLSGLYAGDGVYRSDSLGSSVFGLTRSVDVNVGLIIDPLLASHQTSFQLLQTSAKTLGGASISNVTVQSGFELQIFAGNGLTDPANLTAGGAGGNVSNVTLVSATPSYYIHAGDGGNGKSGGIGGSINKVIEKSSTGLVKIIAGTGGNGTATGGAGGAGGSITGLDLQSDSSQYTVAAGNGGTGLSGGAGGSLLNNNFAGKNPNTGILVSADFTGDLREDLLFVDSGTGTMVISKNIGSGANFTTLSQDPLDPQGSPFIASIGTTPNGAVAADVNHDGFMDIVVSYKNSNSIGIYINDGTGVLNPSDTQVIALKDSPAEVVVGNFIGSPEKDLAILVTNGVASKVLLAEGSVTGNLVSFSPLTASSDLNYGSATDLITDNIFSNRFYSNSFDNLFVGFSSGRVETLLASGLNTAPFSVIDNGLVMGTGISNLDVDQNVLLAFSASAPPPTAATLTTPAVSTAIQLLDFSTPGVLVPISGPNLALLSGQPISAHFDRFSSSNTVSDIVVLSTSTGGSQFDLFGDSGSGYSLVTTVKSSSNLKTFVVNDSGLAALGGSLGRFYFSQNLGAIKSYSLPFSGKSVLASAGDGGNATGTGAGGMGGAIKGINIEATDVSLSSGNGGDSVTGPAGAGGSVSNGGSLLTSSGVSLIPSVLSEKTLNVATGSGGSPSSSGKAASGGAGGAMSGMKLNLLTGPDLSVTNVIKVTTGNGGDGNGGAAGNGGSITALSTSTINGDVSVILGNGGNSISGTKNGGNGGSLTGNTHVLALADDTETLAHGYRFTYQAGAGGTAASGTGGAGGSLGNFDLTLDPANTPLTTDGYGVLDELDATVKAVLTAGVGGAGATGGIGGSVTNIKATTVWDQVIDGGVIANPVVMELHSGSGGSGTVKAGGKGGNVSVGAGNLNGLSFYDPDSINVADPALVITAGDGGSGATVGGIGGSILSLKSNNSIGPNNTVLKRNMLTGAYLAAGAGGSGNTTGGRGGDVSSFSISAQFQFYPLSATTWVELGSGIEIHSGNGGDSIAGKAGGAGNITSGTAGFVAGKTTGGAGLLFMGGTGGTGALAGGLGGAISSLQINIPQQNGIYAAQFYAGAGGNATSSLAKAGNGGDITGITNLKDVNSAITVLQAGNGGSNSIGTGGNGGSVTSINTVGFIGNPNDGTAKLGVFNNGLPQGIFVGRGGTGLTAGLAGSVSNVIARQISAIGAAMDGNQRFGVASSISNVTADLIGFDAAAGTANVYDDGNGGHLSPSQTTALDGFLLAKVFSNIKTFNNARTVAYEFTV